MCLSATIDRVAAPNKGSVGATHDLYDQYYEPPRGRCSKPICATRTNVVTLHEASGALAGFSTLAVLEAQVARRRLRAIYSGDRIAGQLTRCRDSDLVLTEVSKM